MNGRVIKEITRERAENLPVHFRQGTALKAKINSILKKSIFIQ